MFIFSVHKSTQDTQVRNNLYNVHFLSKPLFSYMNLIYKKKIKYALGLQHEAMQASSSQCLKLSCRYVLFIHNQTIVHHLCVKWSTEYTLFSLSLVGSVSFSNDISYTASLTITSDDERAIATS